MKTLKKFLVAAMLLVLVTVNPAFCATYYGDEWDAPSGYPQENINGGWSSGNGYGVGDTSFSFDLDYEKARWSDSGNCAVDYTFWMISPAGYANNVSGWGGNSYCTITEFDLDTGYMEFYVNSCPDFSFKYTSGDTILYVYKNTWYGTKIVDILYKH